MKIPDQLWKSLCRIRELVLYRGVVLIISSSQKLRLLIGMQHPAIGQTLPSGRHRPDKLRHCLNIDNSGTVNITQTGEQCFNLDLGGVSDSGSGTINMINGTLTYQVLL